MPTTLEILDRKIQATHLLTHPFYEAWSNGLLSIEDLRFYARQYFAHVRAFPTYLSGMHSRCDNLEYRRFIANNLADEEATAPTHPELWLDFAAGIGDERKAVVDAKIGPRMGALIATFHALMENKTVEAVAALYCYEKQIPEVAVAKVKGLQDHYGITDRKTLLYFRVHLSADLEHAAQWATILEREKLTQSRATAIADRALHALWGALDEIDEARRSSAAFWT
jgi:pyrroloquinoline-quinone synthase